MAELLFNAILGVAALVAILDYFGIRPGKPSGHKNASLQVDGNMDNAVLGDY